MSKKYFIALLIVIFLFLMAFALSGQMAERKINDVRMIQDKISTDILSIETRFSLLGTSSCSHVKVSDEFETGLNTELSEMARRVKFMETQLGYNNPEVSLIRDQYALLQIKDYMLRKQLSERCGEEIETMLYFFGPNCDKCREQSIILDEIGSRYPEIRIYWFDIDSTTPALKTLQSVFAIKDVPSLVANDKAYAGVQSIEDIEKHLASFIKKLNEERKKKEAEAELEAAKQKPVGETED